MINKRREEASKSLLVQVSSENSYPELFSHCSQFGTIRTAFHYKTLEDQHNFILLEFQEASQFEEVVRQCQFNEENPGVPVASPFVWFKATNRKLSPTASISPVHLKCEEMKLIKDPTLNDLLKSSETIDDQMLLLYRSTCLHDLGIRMRFLAAKQLEAAVSGMFPFVKSLPFGSSVNGFGKMGCDLDLILRIRKEELQNQAENIRLIYHTKENFSNERSQTQRHMETIGDILHLFLPGVSNVRRILQARVPIIKFNHECLDLEVDLSMSNMSGYYMSELLYLFGEIDDRVRPLVFCIRKWASAAGITNQSPGRWISNFSLTLLVIYFLQNVNNPVLPSLSLLTKSATKEDVRIVDGNINCTFLRDLRQLKFQTENNDSLSYLLTQFFEFYSEFDFKKHAISISSEKLVLKPDHEALWIVNPLESLLNVSKNVSFEELDRFRLEVKNAAWILESSYEKSEKDFWGLLQLFRTNKQAMVKPQMFFKSRLVDVTDLFGSNEKEDKPSFRNNSVKTQVESVRKATKREIEKLQPSRLKFKRF